MILTGNRTVALKEAAGARENGPGVLLSVVIPAYNETSRIVPTLEKVLDFLRTRPESCEVVVVDDGSTDKTVELVEEVCRRSGAVRLLRNSVNLGKGAAVRKGMLNARGAYILFTDADLSAPIAEAERLLKPLDEGYDVVIGSRALKREWISIHQPRFRENAGKLFNLFMRGITGLDFRDTQCGFKAFRRKAARAIFACQTARGFGFDAEILYMARKFGYRALEVPVHWDHSAGTKVNTLRDGIGKLFEVLRIRWNDWRGKYEAPAR